VLCTERKRLVHKPGGVASRALVALLIRMRTYVRCRLTRSSSRNTTRSVHGSLLSHEHVTVTLADDVPFSAWAHERWQDRAGASSWIRGSLVGSG
jgi:hypothetical protein